MGTLAPKEAADERDAAGTQVVESVRFSDMTQAQTETANRDEGKLTAEEWYDLVVEASADGSWYYDVDNQAIYYAPSFLDILDLGTGSGHISPEDFMARVHPDDREPYKRLLASHLKGETDLLQVEIRVFNEAGDMRWILSRGIARRNSAGHAYCMLGSIVDITRRRQLEDSLRAVALSSTEGGGAEFFESLARYLAEALGSDFAIIGRLDGDQEASVRTVAVYEDGKIRSNFRYELAGTPCENVMDNSLCAYPDKVAALFPRDAMLSEEQIKGYVGSPLVDSSGRTMGIIAALFRRPVADVSTAEDLLTIFGARAAAELERQAKVEALRESEQKFRDFAEVAADIFWTMDAELRFSYFNDRCYERFMLAPAELLGRTLWELAFGQPADSAEWGRHRKLLENHAPFRDFVYTFKDGRGEHRHMSLSGRPLFDPGDGRFEGYRGVATEITERRRAEAEYQDIFNNASEGIYRSSLDGRLLRANPALVRLHGLQTESELLEAMTDIANQWYVDPEDRARITRRLRKDGRVDNFETEIYRCATGERIWVIENARAVRGDSGEIVYYEGMVHDITERRRLEAQYRDIFDNVGESIYRSTPEGRLVQANPALARLQGFDTPEALLEAVGDLNTDWYLDPNTRPELKRLIEERGYLDGFEAEVRRLNSNERIWTSETVRVTRDAQGKVLYYEGSIRDVTAEHKARELAHHRSVVLEMIARDAPLGEVLHQITAIARQQQEQLVAAIFRLQNGRLYCAAAPELSRGCIETINGSTLEAVGGAVRSALEGDCEVARTRVGDREGGEGRLHKAMRDAGYEALLATPIRDQQGTVLGVITAFSGLSKEAGTSTDLLRELGQIASIAIEQQRLSEALRRQAHYDPLTELPNRALLSDRLEQAIREAERDGHPVGVLLADLDEFKLINDSMGHGAGDRVLQEVARRLRDCLRAGDTVARLGGDEFVLVVPLKDGSEYCSVVAGRLIQALQRNVNVAGREVSTRPSIGISLYPQDGATAEALLQAADTAMYAAKQSGKNRYCYFDRAMNQQVSKRLQVESDLQHALVGGALEIHYQPRIVLDCGACHGAEALLRWRHPQRGLMEAREFVGAAQRGPVMNEIDRFVLREATRTLARWQREGRPLALSINISARELYSDGFVSGVAAALEEAAIDAAGLEIEISESAVLRDYERACDQLRALKSRLPALRVAVDDFGSGYSSLNCLRQLPIDTLKIDESFIAELCRGDDAAAAMVRTIVDFGRSLGLTVVAEGVEHQVQSDALREYGCDQAQGFLYGAAVPLPEFETRYAAVLDA